MHRYDNTAGAPSGTKFISLDKPLTRTQESITFAKATNVTNCWLDSGRDYEISFWAKKTNANTTNIQAAYKFNDAANGAAFSSFTAVALTTTWTKYSYTVTNPATSSGIIFALRVQGS